MDSRKAIRSTLATHLVFVIPSLILRRRKSASSAIPIKPRTKNSTSWSAI